MIFDTLDWIETLSVDARIRHLGTKKKARQAATPHRSNMMLNPLNLTHLNRIDESDADVITLNLEDAIAPSRKKEALYNVALFLSHLTDSRSFIVVRTNPLDEGGAEEIRFLNNFGFDAVRLAKVKSHHEIEQALALLSEEKELHISLETKEVFLDIASLSIDPRFTTANLGILDLLTSLSLPQSIVQIGNPTVDHLLSRFLIDVKAAGLHPVSFMFQDYHDTEMFRRWCLYERSMGFDSKACMGPKQVAIANEVFGSTAEEYARARHIKEAFETHAAQGINGFMDAIYGFIDEPIYKDALLILQALE